MDAKMKNQIKLGIFCALLGAVAGTILWIFLKLVTEGTALIWEWLPERADLPFYTVAVCTFGGLLIGLFRKKYGDYPEELDVVLKKVKQEKRYDYNNMLVMILAAILPLLFGSSVGPEAGMTGIIVGLCYWAGENMKFAQNDAKAYSEIGTAVTLSVLFHSPLFGIFAVEEQENSSEIPQIARGSKIFLYGLAFAAGTSCFMLLNGIFGACMEGFPYFTAENNPTQKDYLMIAVYILIGCLLAGFYHLTHKGSYIAAAKIPPVLREILGGLCLGIIGTLVPAVMFSGEEQMALLMEEYTAFLPWMLAGTALLKILMTNICIQSGLKGGHFFPLIFAGVCMGYAAAVFVFPESGSHVVLAAAVVTAALLGGIMKKPLAVTMLLFLCFPAKMFIWIFLSALIGSKVCSIRLSPKTPSDAS